MMFLFSLLLALSIAISNSGAFPEPSISHSAGTPDLKSTPWRREGYDVTTNIPSIFRADSRWSSLSTMLTTAPSKIFMFTKTDVSHESSGNSVTQQYPHGKYLRSVSGSDRNLNSITETANAEGNHQNEEVKVYDDDTLPPLISAYFQQVLPSMLHLNAHNDTNGDSADDDGIRGVIRTDQETPFLVRVRNILSQGGVIAGVVCGFLFLCLITRLIYLRYRLRNRLAQKRYLHRRSKISPWTIITAEMMDHSGHRGPVMAIVPDHSHLVEVTVTPTVFASTIVSNITEDNLRNSGLNATTAPRHLGVWRETSSPPPKNLLAAVASLNSYFVSQDGFAESSEHSQRSSNSNNSNVDGSYLEEEETRDVESGSDEKQDEEEGQDAIATPHSAGSIASDDVLVTSACRVKQQATPRSSNSSTHTSAFFPFSRFASRRRSSSRQQSTSEFEVDIVVC